MLNQYGLKTEMILAKYLYQNWFLLGPETSLDSLMMAMSLLMVNPL